MGVKIIIPHKHYIYEGLSKIDLIVAERAGFEPAIPLRVYKLSRLAHSATLTPLRFEAANVR